MKKENALVREFQQLVQQQRITIHDVSQFLREKQEQYVATIVQTLEKKGTSHEESYNKASQSWRVTVGHILQTIIYEALEEMLREKNVKVTSDKYLAHTNTGDQELDLVRHMLLVHYEKYSFLPDADVILYMYDEERKHVRILAVLSIKNSFRERGFETTYWSMKLKENPSTKHIKFFLSTPDKDNEIAYIQGKHGSRKMRVIMEYELDGIYMVRQQDFERTRKVKGFEELFQDIMTLVDRATE